MKVLMVGPDYNAKGGMATVMKNFYYYYPNKDEMFFLISWKENNKISALINSALTIRKVIRHESIDIVHFHVSEDFGFYRKAMLSLLVGKRAIRIFHFHSATFDVFYQKSNRFAKFLIRTFINQVDQVVALTQNWKGFYGQITQTNVSIINNSVPVPSENVYRMSSVNIITLGRVGYRKGSYDILRLAEEMSEDFSQFHFYLYGDGEEEKEDLKTKIIEKKLKNIHVMDWIEDIGPIMEKTGLHLLPSYHEGLPMSVLETMSYGIPNMASDVGGLSEVIEDGKNSILVTPMDIQEMKSKIIKLMSSSELRKALSINARKTIIDRFSLQNYFKQWQVLYQQLIEKKQNK